MQSRTAGTAVSLREGDASTVEGNRFELCERGIDSSVNGSSFENNCMIDMTGPAIVVRGGESGTRGTFITNNTCITGADNAVSIEGNAECIVDGNIFCCKGDAISAPADTEEFKCFTVGNVAAASSSHRAGVDVWEPIFDDRAAGDYSVDTSHGAHGWMAEGRVIVIAPHGGEEDYPLDEEGSEDGVEEKGEELSPEQSYERSLFFGLDGIDDNGFEDDDDSDMGEENDKSIDEDGIRNYSDWDIV